MIESQRLVKSQKK